MLKSEILTDLVLPKRFEILERKTKENKIDITNIVKQVGEASEEIDKLLYQVKSGGLGRFVFFLGKSGSGKTTFLRTLPHFFKNIDVVAIEKNVDLLDVPNFVKDYKTPNQKLFIIHDRDNPDPSTDEKIHIFFEKLRVLFREIEGNVLIIWPITDVKRAEDYSKTAWEIGRESIVPLSGAIFNFNGLDKSLFYEVADTTTRNLNGGESLEAFGITKESVDKETARVTTISEYYSIIEQKSFNINNKTWSMLEKRVIPKVWVLLPGDDSTELDRTVRTLTQGTRNKIDIDRLCEYLDNPSNTSAYLNDWRDRRSNIAYLMRIFDVRLFEVNPGLALSAIRTYGASEIKNLLNLKTASEDKCIDLIKRSRFYTTLTDSDKASTRATVPTEEETANEYKRIQQLAAKNDKPLNKALALAIKKALDFDGITNKVTSEKKSLAGTSLQPDLQIELENQMVFCLEPTWRSTGTEVKGEIKKKQNTLTPGHIQKYILEKVIEYVKEFGF